MMILSLVLYICGLLFMHITLVYDDGKYTPSDTPWYNKIWAYIFWPIVILLAVGDLILNRATEEP